MRKFTCRPFGDIDVDLDDPKTYEYLPQNIKEVRDLMFREIGYTYCYMNYYHKDIFDNYESGIDQKKRINTLIENFTKNEKENCNNLMWYQEQVFLFQDENENMC